jgi:hypothetical protein
MKSLFQQATAFYRAFIFFKVVNHLKQYKKRYFKFTWSYYGRYKNDKKLSFEEMIQKYLTEAKETQKILFLRSLKKR